jgi:alpha-beta hydrolase superfamily lysophospholipase
LPRRPFLALLLLLAACGMPAAPENMEGARIAAWSPAKAPRAVIVALHGFGDHKAAFKEFGAYAAERQVLVEAYDQPGFGERPDRGRWQGTDAMVEALGAAVAAARQRHPGLPVYVLGESMGAAVALVALTRPGAPEVDGLILSAPAVWAGTDMPRGFRTALRLIATVLPPLRVSGRNFDVLASDNIEMLRDLGRDPLYVRELRIDAVAGLVDLMDAAREQAPALTLPTLVVLGARDEIVPPQASRAFLGLLRTSPCAVVTYLDGWHLLLRDHQRQKVFEDILAWTDNAPLPSRLDHPCRPEPAQS